MNSFLGLIFISAVLFQTCTSDLSVAIIGKGITGSITAFCLKIWIPNIKIDIYEHEPEKLEGFLNIHTEFEYINKRVLAKIDNKTLQFQKPPKEIFYNGKKTFPFDVSILESSKLYENFKKFVSEKFKKFQNIYKLQEDKNNAYESVNDLLEALKADFETYTGIGFLEMIKQNNIPMDGITKNFVKASFLSRYTQNLNINGFTGLANLFFSEITGEIKTVSYETVMSDILKDIKIVSENVEKITRKNGKNFISLKNEEIGYDCVVVASTKAKNIVFEPEISKDHFEDFKSHGTCVKGNFLEKITADGQIQSVLNVQQFEKYIKMDDPSDICVVGLKKAPELSGIKKILKVNKVVKTREFQENCPDYSKFKFVQNANFVLGENLYNVLAIEWIDNSLEMKAISAKNISLLIRKKFNLE